MNVAKDGAAAGQRLEAAFIAAAAFGSVDVDDHVADLARRAVDAGVGLAIDDDARADAGAEEDADEMFGLRLQLRLEDAERVQLAVVLHEHRHVEQLLQGFLERKIFPAQIGREDDAALLRVHRAGRANADPDHLAHGEITFIDRVLHAPGDAVDDLVGAAMSLGADLDLAKAVEGRVKDAGKNLGTAEIDADQALGFSVVGHGRRLGIKT